MNHQTDNDQSKFKNYETQDVRDLEPQNLNKREIKYLEKLPVGQQNSPPRITSEPNVAVRDDPQPHQQVHQNGHQRHYYESEMQQNMRYAHRRVPSRYEYDPYHGPYRYEVPQYNPRDEFYMLPDYSSSSGRQYMNSQSLNFKILPFEVSLNESAFHMINSSEQVHLNALPGCIRHTRSPVTSSHPYQVVPPQDSGEIMMMPVRVFRNGEVSRNMGYYYKERQHHE